MKRFTKGLSATPAEPFGFLVPDDATCNDQSRVDPTAAAVVEELLRDPGNIES